MASASTTSGTAGTSGTGEWAWWPLKVAGNPVWNTSDTMTAWGLWNYYNENDPLTALYASICAKSNPGGSFIAGTNKYGYGHAVPTPQGLEGTAGTTNGAWEIFCEMCLRTRAVLFCESVIGDCGAFVPVGSPSGGDAAAIGLGENALGAIPVVGGLLSSTLGAVSGLLTGQAHAQAVSTEKQTLCSLASEYSAELQNAWAAFENGQLSPASFYGYVKGLASDFAQDVEKIVKPCNAACGMIGVMNAHALFAGYASGVVALPAGLAGTDFIIAGTGTPISLGSETATPAGGGAENELAPAQTTAVLATAAATTTAATLSTSPVLIIIGILIVLLVVL